MKQTPKPENYMEIQTLSLNQLLGKRKTPKQVLGYLGEKNKKTTCQNLCDCVEQHSKENAKTSITINRNIH